MSVTPTRRHAAAETLQQTGSALAQQSALIVEMQRQSSEQVSHLAEVRAQYATLSSAYEQTRAALSRAERQLEGSLMARADARGTARRVEELLATMRRSTSWRLTAPLRMIRRLVPGAPDSWVRLSRHKEYARQVFHRSARLFLRLPGARRGVRLTYAMAPGPVEWLALRYRAYEQGVAGRQQTTALLAVGAEADLIPNLIFDLNEEELRVYRQFATGGFAAAAKV
jgi:hypothetical protein